MSIDMKETATTAGSAVFLFNWAWLDWLPMGWSLTVTVLGGIVLGLTAANKFYDLQIKRQQLHEHKAHELEEEQTEEAKEHQK